MQEEFDRLYEKRIGQIEERTKLTYYGRERCA